MYREMRALKEHSNYLWYISDGVSEKGPFCTDNILYQIDFCALKLKSYVRNQFNNNWIEIEKSIFFGQYYTSFLKKESVRYYLDNGCYVRNSFVETCNGVRNVRVELTESEFKANIRFKFRNIVYIAVIPFMIAINAHVFLYVIYISYLIMGLFNRHKKREGFIDSLLDKKLRIESVAVINRELELNKSIALERERRRAEFEEKVKQQLALKKIERRNSEIDTVLESLLTRKQSDIGVNACSFYIMHDRGIVKFGISNDPYSRRSQHKKMTNLDFTIYKIIWFRNKKNARKLEDEIRSFYKNKRKIHFEWLLDADKEEVYGVVLNEIRRMLASNINKL
jgi:hypothetical protein